MTKLRLDHTPHRKLLAAVFETVGVDRRLWKAMADSLIKNNIEVEAVFFAVKLMHQHSPKIYGNFVDLRNCRNTTVALIDDYLDALRKEV